MNQFIQSLESRTLFSAVDLTGDQAAILADATSVKADTASLASQDKTELAAVTADLKGLPKTNAPLLKLVRTDISKITSGTNSDRNTLLNSSSADAKRAVLVGNKLESSFTTANQNAVTKDTDVLGTLVAPLGPIDLDLGKLQTDLTGPLVTDLGTLGASNQTATQLAADIAALNAAYAAASAQLTADASQYQTDLTALTSDLNQVAAGVPNILFDYTGSIKATNGKNKGKSEAVAFDVTVEAADGSYTASVTTQNGAGVDVTVPVVGTVTNTGAFTGQFTSGNGTGELLTGQVSGNTIKGTDLAADSGTGSFVVSHT